MLRFLRVSQTIASAAALWFIFCFVVVALFSMHYPYPLEWMEGLSIDVMARVVAGKAMYVEPHLDYVPFIYPPLYFYVSALASYVVGGVEFFPARLVSTLSAIGTGFVLFHWVRREGGDRKTAIISAGLFYSSYELSARWFDVARIDSLYIVLLLSGLYALVHGRSVWASVLAGVLFTAAFFTKQNVAIVVFPVLLVGLWTARMHTLRTAIVFASISAAIFFTLNHASDGWMKYYTLDLPASHSIDRRYIWGFWLNDMLRHVWPLMLVVAVGWWSMFRADRRKAVLYLALLAGLVGAAYMGRLHRFGWSNVLISGHLALALVVGVMVAQWIRAGKHIHAVAALALSVLQMGLLAYNPVYLIPTEDAREEGDAFLRKLSKLEGEIFMPEIQFIQTRIGKKSYDFGMPAIDVLQSDIPGRNDVRDKLYRELMDALTSHRFAGIIYSGMVSRHVIDAHYVRSQPMPFPNEVVSGYQPRQYWLMVPKKNTPARPAPPPRPAAPPAPPAPASGVHTPTPKQLPSLHPATP